MKSVLLGVIFFASCAVAGNGAEKTWNGNVAVSSNWFDADNWDPPGVPAPEDHVTVTKGTVMVPSDVTIAALNFNTGTISTTNILTITNLTWGNSPEVSSGSATFNGAGRVVIPPQGTLVFRGDSSCMMRTGVVENLGRAVNATSRSLLLFHQAVFHNAGTFEIHTNFTFDGDNGPPGGVLSNSGTLIVTGATTRVSFVRVSFHNSGRTELSRGVFACGSGNSVGPIDISLTATQQVTGPSFTLGSGASFPGPGLFLHSSGTIDAGANDFFFPNYRFEGGKLTGTNTFVMSNFIWAGGEISGSGLLRVPPEGTLNIVAGNNKRLTARELRNEGSGLQHHQGLPGSLDVTLQSGGLFHNAGTLLTMSGYWIGGGPGPMRGFYNSGTLIRTNRFSETPFYVPITNAGRVVLAGGNLRMLHGYVQIAGSTELGSDTILNSGSCLIRGGKLIGEGQIVGTVANHGDILPGNPIGTLGIFGYFTNHGRIFIETSQSQGGMTNDQIIVSHIARLGGTMSVYWRDVPPSMSFFGIRSANLFGTLARIDGLELGRGWKLAPSYTPTGLSFVVQQSSALNDHLSVTPCPNDAFQIRFTGTPDRAYEIERTEDLVQWTPLWQTNSPNGFISFIDEGASEHPHRFYRAVQRP